MSAPDQGQRGSGVAPGSEDNQGATTISTQFEAPATSTSSATVSSSSIASSSTSSPNGERTIIIGVVIGGVGTLLLLSLLVICCIQRRRKQRASKQLRGAEPVTYTGLNSAFAGVPFRDSHHSSLSPQPLLLSNSNTTYLGAPSPGQRTNETDGFLYNSNRDLDSPQHSPQFSPRHSPSQPYSAAHSGTRPHSRTHSRVESSTSPLTLNDASEAHVLSNHGPLSPGDVEPPISQVPAARDTMGFPVEHAAALEEIRLQTMSPVLLSPKPRHPLAHQASLERVVREGMLAPSPAPSNSAPGRLRVISQDYSRESPVLGLRNPVVIQNPAITMLGGGLGRNDSQRTVSSISTMGPVIRDEELENLGIGARPQPLRFREI
ncbi:hypothetical protein BKA65DRAFT_5549 [Rhexocercosporidium sp. MPI-PUGE-AT-0058]|nr:hypothetical protein BKA65DRAFT_5549 [Rhexocercosporidium sp. MPI-PUGE-AT-0058]